MSKAMEHIRQAALAYENAHTGAAGVYDIPPTNKISIDVNTVFAAMEDYDIMCKVVFALEKLARDLRAQQVQQYDKQ
jgi:hypothetical protein